MGLAVKHLETYRTELLVKDLEPHVVSGTSRWEIYRVL